MTEVAPSLDKVGPEPSVAQPNGQGASLVAAATTKAAQQNSVSEGLNSHLPVAYKPVEVTSVPETPVNGGQTPAGGTPRPELKTTEDETEQNEKPKEAPVILGPGSGEKAPAPEPVTDSGAPGKAPERDVEMTGTLQTGGSTPAGEKRKAAEEESKATQVVGQPTEEDPAEKKTDEEKPPSDADEQRPEKKVKTTDIIADKVADVKEKVTDVKEKVEAKVGANGKGKPGRPRKDKKAPLPVGKTERKTRSQGPID